MLVDSHLHLEFKDFAQDLEAVLARAKVAGVGIMVSIGTRQKGWESIYNLIHPHPQLYMTAGVHPCDIEGHDLDAVKAGLKDYLSRERVIGVGETGLDFFHKPYDAAKQKDFFRLQIEMGRHFDIPVVVHSRNAEDETVTVLEEAFSEGPLRVVLHCFSGSLEMAKACLNLGCYFSASGILTFKNAKSVQEVFTSLPLDKILVETDAPYLAPAPHRGKRNEPAFVKLTAEQLANLRGASFKAIAEATTQNFFTLFSRAQRPHAA
jgi:TatD DNase family protein